MLERLTIHPGFEWLARRADDWRVRPADSPPTRYETKAIAQGRMPVYLRFRRRAG
jgi:tRNA (guanine-N7-)-methyltransferase